MDDNTLNIEITPGNTVILADGVTIGAGTTVTLGHGSSVIQNGQAATNTGDNPVIAQASGLGIVTEFATEPGVTITGAMAAVDADAGAGE